MLYTERRDFLKDYIAHWADFDECSAIADGFKCYGCTALFIEDHFNIHFGFYDPNGKKIGEYVLNTETGATIMVYDERYVDLNGSDCTGILADILGGILGSEEYFTLVNKPFVICEDAPKAMTMEEIWKDILSSMEEGDQEEY